MSRYSLFSLLDLLLITASATTRPTVSADAAGEFFESPYGTALVSLHQKRVEQGTFTEPQVDKISQLAAGLSITRRRSALRAATLLLRPASVCCRNPDILRYQAVHSTSKTLLTRGQNRQLVREGEAQKGYGHWSDALPQHRPAAVQEWFPDWCSQGRPGSCGFYFIVKVLFAVGGTDDGMGIFRRAVYRKWTLLRTGLFSLHGSSKMA